MSARKAGAPAEQREEKRGAEGRTGLAAAWDSETGRRNGKLASFCGIAPAAVDSPGWPVYPGLWIGPNLTTTAPRASGLCVERKYRIPARGLCEDVSPLPGSLKTCFEARSAAPDLRLRFPHSRLAPAGWDPRSVRAVSDQRASSIRKSKSE